MRAAIYARFSTDLQSERSITDQVELCRSLCAREALEIVAVFEDRARSGASILGRDGLLALLESARAKQFDVLVVEAFDRLSRDMEDLAGLYKRLPLLGVEIRSVHEGVADTVSIGLRGVVGQLYREDGVKKIRRGMAGVIRDGRHAGGRAYGYRPAEGRPGELVIVAEEAAIVARIFAEFAAGASPRQIAGGLNRDRIAPPRGARWTASALNGTASRGNGILGNALYGGMVVWNKVRMVKNPDTGKRLSRVNPPTEWQRVPAPQLAIVEAGLWEAVQARRAAARAERTAADVSSGGHNKVAPAAMPRRPGRIFSGLLKCGLCGAGLSTHDRDKTGKTRLRCSSVRESGTCVNRRLIYAEAIEAEVLAGMRAALEHPDAIALYVRRYNDERRRLAAGALRTRAALQRAAAEAARELERAIDALIKGRLSEEEADRRLPDLRAAKAAAEAALIASDEPPKVVTLHPAAIDLYLASLADLAAAIAGADLAAADRADVAARVRELIDSIIVTPRAPRQGFDIVVNGRLNRLLGGDGAVFPQARYSGFLRVAGVRYGAEPTIVWPMFSTRPAA